MATHEEIFDENAGWYTKLTNRYPLMVDDTAIETYAAAWLFKENGSWVFKPRAVYQNWQYANAIFFVRTNIEFFVWLALHITFLSFVHGWWMLGVIPFFILSTALFGDFPYAFFMQIRWEDKPVYWFDWIPKLGGKQVKQYLQFGIGWKQSGRYAIHFRFETDDSSQAGYHVGMPNNGQAQGFDFGNK